MMNNVLLAANIAGWSFFFLYVIDCVFTIMRFKSVCIDEMRHINNQAQQLMMERTQAIREFLENKGKDDVN